MPQAQQAPAPRKRKSNPKAKTGSSIFAMHQGQALKVVADTYPKLDQVILEAVQNAIDASPKQVWIDINFVDRTIMIMDNGEGVTKSNFEQALKQVCSSQKTKGKLGRFGRGLVAPFGKCSTFTFTSCPSPKATGYIEWFFDKSMLKQERISAIPYKGRPELTFNPAVEGNPFNFGTNVPWRTKVVIYGFTEDRVVSNINPESLVVDILSSFGKSMRHHKTVITLQVVDEKGGQWSRDFTSEDFQGDSLGEQVYTTEHAGDVSFRLHIANMRSGRRSGRVLLGETDDVFRVEFLKLITAFTNRGVLSDTVMHALNSGFFEGEIVGGVHLHPNRKTFLADDAFLDFCIAIETWFQDHGRLHYESVADDDKNERFQRVGLASLQAIELLLKNSDYGTLLRQALDGFKLGSIGGGHIDVGGKADGLQDVTSVAVQGSPIDRGSSTGLGYEKKDPTAEHSSHNPLTVVGPKGNRRRTVKNGSFGLQLRFDELTGSTRVFELDEKAGILSFNIRHPLWIECQNKERHLKAFQIHVVIHALTQCVLPEDHRASYEVYFETLIGPFVETLFITDAYTSKRKK